MNFIKTSAALILVSSLAGFAHAQDASPTASDQDDSGFYGALGIATYEAETLGADVKLGYDFNKYFGVEAQGILGLSTDSGPISSSPTAATISIKPEYTIGAFGVARLPLNEQFEVFARGGFHNTRTNIKIKNALGTDFDEDVTGLAAGLGLQYNIDAKNGIRADYTYLGDGSDDGGSSPRETVSLSFVRKF